MTFYEISQQVQVAQLYNPHVIIAMNHDTVNLIRDELIVNGLAGPTDSNGIKVKIAGSPILIADEIPIGEIALLTECKMMI